LFARSGMEQKIFFVTIFGNGDKGTSNTFNGERIRAAEAAQSLEFHLKPALVCRGSGDMIALGDP